jgi:hypothetical protein
VAAVRAAMCCSVRQCALVMRQCAAIDLRVSTLIHRYTLENSNFVTVWQCCAGRSVRQCEEQCVAVRAAVCGYLVVWQCPAKQCGSVCGSVW